MHKWYRRAQYTMLVAASGGLFALGGCGLNDQQLASVWSTVISTGLSSIISNVITTVFKTNTAA